MKLFYRLESATRPTTEPSVFNMGAYRADISNVLGVDDISGDTHPTPRTDPILRDTWIDMGYEEQDRWYFGFHSLQYLSNWFFLFPDLVQAVHVMGIARIGVYEVPDSGFHKGQFQAIANSKYNTSSWWKFSRYRTF